MSHSSDARKNRQNDWQEGVEHFNNRRFWEAHESWERGWRSLPVLEKIHVQSLIQTAAVFDLMNRGRPGAARRVALLALKKLENVRKNGGLDPVFPRLDIPGLEPALIDLCASLESETGRKISKLTLKARLLLSPP